MTDNLIEAIAKAIWEDQRNRIGDQTGFNAKLTWRSNGAPGKFWDSYVNDARAALKVIEENKK